MMILFLILVIVISVIVGFLILVQNPKGGGLAGNIADDHDLGARFLHGKLSGAEFNRVPVGGRQITRMHFNQFGVLHHVYE